MKTRLILGFLLVTFSVQTMGMGHPHNLFAARKLVKAKSAQGQTSRGGGATAMKPGSFANWILTTAYPRAVKAVM